jgi:hypothetical protein
LFRNRDLPLHAADWLRQSNNDIQGNALHRYQSYRHLE